MLSLLASHSHRLLILASSVEKVAAPDNIISVLKTNPFKCHRQPDQRNC